MPYVNVSYYLPLEDQAHVLDIARRMGEGIKRTGLTDFDVSVSERLPIGGETRHVTYDVWPESGKPRDWTPFAWPPRP